MKINTNKWNRIRYTFYSPIYDVMVRVLEASRKRSIELLSVKPGDKILIVGAGTGLDLKFLPSNCTIVATDITPSMIEKVKQRNVLLSHNVEAIVMDGQALAFQDNTFDKIILHLILAVIPDPVACIKECERVLKPGGKIAVFDKFVRKNTKISVLRRCLNPISNFLATNIIRDFESIVAPTNFTVLTDEAADFYGNFRRIQVTKSN